MMCCLQHHQLTGTHEGLGADAAQLLVVPQESERQSEKKSVSFRLLLRNRVSACDSQSVHLGAVEGAARHLLDAISGEPSGSRKRSQVSQEAARRKRLRHHWLELLESFLGF